MTDEQKPEEPMTAQDVRLEEFQAQLDELKASYEAQLNSYQKANRELFAMLNSKAAVAETVSDEPRPAKAGFDMDACERAFMKAYTKQSDRYGSAYLQ